MEQMNCLNLCDILHLVNKQGQTIEEFLEMVQKESCIDRWSRLYVGSYFCGPYFIHMDMECVNHLITYDFEDERNWVRIGRAIYFENESGTITGAKRIRWIYFPIRTLLSEVSL